MIHPYFNMSGGDARGLLYGLMEVDKIQLREDPSLPSMRKLIQDGRVRYKRADPEEHWQTYKEIVDQTRYGGTAQADCEDLASALAAEDQVRYGVQSLPYAYSPREGLFHVVTAVPTGQYGAVPQGSWPPAQGAPPVMGYVLQDPSAAAGMGSFGALPGGEVATMAGYGALPEVPTRRRRRRGTGQGIGGILRAFKTGLIGEGTAEQAMRELGAGARKGTGIEKGWAGKLGEQLPGRFVPGLAPPTEAEGEAAAVAALKKGAETEAVAEVDVEDEDFEDLDEDEEFGFFGRMWFEDDPDLYSEEMGFEPEDLVGSKAWGADRLATRVADDMFGAVHLGDDAEDYAMGIFHGSVEGSLADAHEAVGPRRFGALDHLTPPPRMQPPDRPIASYGELDEDDDEFGLFGLGKKERQAKLTKRWKKTKAQLDSPKSDRQEARLEKKLERIERKLDRLGVDVDDLEDEEMGSFGFLPREALFAGLGDDEDDEDDGFDAELEDLDLELTAEGF